MECTRCMTCTYKYHKPKNQNKAYFVLATSGRGKLEVVDFLSLRGVRMPPAPIASQPHTHKRTHALHDTPPTLHSLNPHRATHPVKRQTKKPHPHIARARSYTCTAIFLSPPPLCPTPRNKTVGLFLFIYSCPATSFHRPPLSFNPIGLAFGATHYIVIAGRYPLLSTSLPPLFFLSFFLKSRAPPH